MGRDATTANLLGRWLMARMHDPAVASLAVSLHTSLERLARDEVATPFRDGLRRRVAQLAGLVEAMDLDAESHAAPPSPACSQWRQNARRLLSRWNDVDWTLPVLELSSEKNPIMIAAVDQSLEAAIPANEEDRDLARLVRKLRLLDEKPHAGLPVPPGPLGPWDPSAYLVPGPLGGLVASLDALVREAATTSPSASLLVPLRDLTCVIQNIQAGWPIASARLAMILKNAAEQVAGPSPLADALEAAMRRLPGDDRSFETDAAAMNRLDPSAATVTSSVREQAREELNAIVRTLRADPSAEAQAFGNRLADVNSSPDTATPENLHRELVGCLAFLDESGVASRGSMAENGRGDPGSDR